MRRWLLLVTTLLASIQFVAADIKWWSESSPDKTFFADVRQVSGQDLIPRRNVDGFGVVIYRGGSSDKPKEIYSRHDFALRTIMRIAWSPDSKFLLFTTASSGGRSPWRFQTFVFCIGDGTFRGLEDVTRGAVVAPGFHFEPPDIAVLTVQDTAAPQRGLPEKQIKIPLAKLSHRMRRLR